MKKKRKIDIDTIAMNLLVVLLIVISTMSLVILRDFIGYVGYHAAEGGRITEINVYQKFEAYEWHGIGGIVIASTALNTSWFVYANPGTISEWSGWLWLC